MTTPNIFTHARSELSQDAVWAWLLAWADQKHASSDTGLHALGLDFLRLLLTRCGLVMPTAISICVQTQKNHMDVVANINNDAIHLVIEDKVWAGLTGDQLARYRSKIEQLQPDSQSRALVYLRTGDQSDAQAQNIERQGWAVVNRQDILRLLHEHTDAVASNAIARDFCAHLQRYEDAFNRWTSTPIAGWGDAAWRGFFSTLRSALAAPDMDWGWVAGHGQFWGCWWHAVRTTAPSANLYLQIEANPRKAAKLRFKISQAQPEERSKCLDTFKTHLKQIAKTQAFTLQQSHLRTGETMTIGQWSGGPFPAQRADGLIDLPQTLRLLNHAQRVAIALIAELKKAPHEL